MKILLKMFERMKPTFDQGGKLGVAKPLFDAMENFFFSPTASALHAPHVRDPLDLKRYMSMVIIALLPAFAMSIYYFGIRVLAMTIVSYAAGGAVEVIFAFIRKEEINEGFLVTGLLFPLILPPTTPLWMVALGVAFGVLVGKELFGGTGRNLFNPALLGRCFLALAYPAAMAKSWIEPIAKFPECLWTWAAPAVDAVTTATPLAEARKALGTIGQEAGTGEALTDWTNLLWGNVAGSVGETSALAIIIGGVFLVAIRVANWRTVAGTLGSFALFAGILNWVHPESYAPAGWHMLAGGVLFGAFFMATDPVTSPTMKSAKWLYGILIGSLTVLIRSFSPGYVEGMTFAILLGNITAPILDEIVVHFHVRRLQHER